MHKLNCKQCNEEFILKPGRGKIFCSIVCSNKSRAGVKRNIPKEKKNCFECGVIYFFYKSRTDTTFYCSSKCQMTGRLKRNWNSKTLSKECLNCKKEFKTYKSQDNIFCSNKCHYALTKKKSWLKYKQTCLVCSKEFIPPRMAEGGTYCSRKCRGKHVTKDRIERKGYWYIRLPEHPDSSKQGYIAEHRVIMEKIIGRRLQKHEDVHHIDHNKKNNTVRNLEVLDAADHRRYHSNKMWETRSRKGLFKKKQGVSYEA